MKKLLAALVFAASLAGCAGMGGDRGTEPAAGQRPVGQVVDDAAITAQIKAALAADPDLSAVKINVDTAQGAVKLKGEVKTIALRRKANELATGVKGVKSVDNQLVITG